MMREKGAYFMIMLGALFLFVLGCDSYDNQSPDDFYDHGESVIILEATKTPGKGQYRVSAESSDTISIAVHIKSATELKGLEIKKTRNLDVEEAYGDMGKIKVEASGDSFDYLFVYNPSPEDVDQLIGFTFNAITEDGNAFSSDLTARISLSPIDNLQTKRWNLSSIKHVNNEKEPGKESIEDCEKDNSYLFNPDGTMVLDYGDNTGEGACAFDGLEVYDKWSVSEDQKEFMMEKYNVFAPDTRKVDTFKVKTLSIDRLELELTVDLSELGERDEEIFLYSFEPTPK